MDPNQNPNPNNYVPPSPPDPAIAPTQPPAGPGMILPTPVYAAPQSVGVAPTVLGGPVGAPGESPDKEYILAIIFSYFFGGLGVDRFYLGRIKTGILKLITFGGLGIWHFVDLLLITFGKMRDEQGLPLKGYAQYNKTFKMVTLVVVGFQALIFLAFAIFFVASVITGSTVHTTSSTSNTLPQSAPEQPPAANQFYTN